MVKKPAPSPKPRPTYRRLYIAEWIEHQGRKQTEVAAAADISESHLSLVIAGKRPYVQGKLEAIADFLGIDPGDLFYPPKEGGDWLSVAGLSQTERLAALNVVASFRKK